MQSSIHTSGRVAFFPNNTTASFLRIEPLFRDYATPRYLLVDFLGHRFMDSPTVGVAYVRSHEPDIARYVLRGPSREPNVSKELLCYR